VLLPGFGERSGGVVVPGDAGEGVAEPSQMGGEGVGLFEGERGEGQSASRWAVEDRLGLAVRLQSSEEDGSGGVRARVGPPFLHRGERRVVQDGARAEKVPGPGEEVVDVLGEVPGIREHAS
jgi:hypothetical protein